MAGAGDLPLDEGFIAVLVLLLVLLLSTGYVYIQQAPGAAAAAAANNNNNNAAAARAGAPRPSALRTTAPDAIPTAGLSDALLRLHRALPTRHGARTATVCADALLRRKEDADAQWVSADAAAALSDLLQLADVYVLCVVRDAGDRAIMERVRALLAESGSDGRRLQSHKVLFCTTVVGKVAFVRQLEPQLHIEVDQSVVRDLEKHVPRIVHVTPAPQESAAAGSSAHHVADSLAGYFKLLAAIGSP